MNRRQSSVVAALAVAVAGVFAVDAVNSTAVAEQSTQAPPPLPPFWTPLPSPRAGAPGSTRRASTAVA